MKIQRNKREFPFQSFGAEKIETDSLQREVEFLYKFLRDDVDVVVKAVEAAVTPIETDLAAVKSESAASTASLATLTTRVDKLENVVDTLKAIDGSFQTQLDNLSTQISDLDTRLTADEAFLVPSGLISMWSGLLANIPAGWYLCDGSNGTPDLRSRFIKGAAAGVDPGGTGGSATHFHDITAQPTSSDSAGTPAGTNSAPTFTGSPVAAASTQATPDLVAVDTSAAGVSPVTTAAGTVSAPVFTGSALAGHSHTVTGVTDAKNGEPPYFKLAFIMKS